MFSVKKGMLGLFESNKRQKECLNNGRRQKAKIDKTHKSNNKAASHFCCVLFLALLPLPRIIRLIGFVVSLAFVIGEIFLEAVLVFILIKRRNELNEKTKKVILIFSVVLPIVSIALIILLLLFIYPDDSMY